jgi:hypothetical protein
MMQFKCIFYDLCWGFYFWIAYNLVRQDCHLNIKSNFAATENFKNLGHILPK